MTPLLAVRGISKRFGAVQALANVDLDFHAGEIHAVLGENGAGKSTLMNLLNGLHRADAGSVLLDGHPVHFRSPHAAHNAGIGMVHQHFTLIEALTVAENLALSLPNLSPWRFDAAAAGHAAQAVADRVGLDLSAPSARVAELSVGARQRLEILKAIANAGRVLILDEPTAILTPHETQQLFELLRQLRAQNHLVIFITHKLREVTELADRVTIMRRGHIVGTYPIGAITKTEMAERMVGDAGGSANVRHDHQVTQAVVLQMKQVSALSAQKTPALDNLNTTVHAGEIFGIAGVDGNGQRELFEVLAGLSAPTSGSVWVGDHRIETYTPRHALAAGIAHIPPDRQREGLVLAMSVAENCLLNHSILNRLSRGGLLQRRAAREFARTLMQRYAVQLANLDVPASSLSGGNQQRVIVARELAEHPRVLVTVNPTRGLDITAARMVAEALVAVARKGCAVVLISTDLDEIIELSDRVSVLFRGRLSTPMMPPIDVERLGLLMAGAT